MHLEAIGEHLDRNNKQDTNKALKSSRKRAFSLAERANSQRTKGELENVCKRKERVGTVSKIYDL